METVTVQTTQNIDIEYEVAGLGERILAWLIDFGFFVALYFVLLIAAFAISWGKVITITVVVLYIFSYALYDLLSEVFFNGQSFGKRIMKIKVISLNGARPSVSQYLLRWLFRIVDFTLTGGVCALISVAVSYKKQRVGDIVAGTTLIKTSPRTQMDSIVFMNAVDSHTPVFTNIEKLTDADVALMNDVIKDYNKTGNSVLTYNMATRIKQHLDITAPPGMDDYEFLQTILKDHNYLHNSVQTYTPVFTTVTQLTDNDLALIHEVITNYKKTANTALITNMAARIKEHLGVTAPEYMEDYKFLQTIIKDYSYLTAMGV